MDESTRIQIIARAHAAFAEAQRQGQASPVMAGLLVQLDVLLAKIEQQLVAPTE